jgi:hypothetical protein
VPTESDKIELCEHELREIAGYAADGARRGLSIFEQSLPADALSRSDRCSTRFAEVTAALRELPRLIPEIRSFKCGPDVGVNPGNWDFAVVAQFDSIDNQTIYRDQHQRMITDLIAPIRADWAAVQYDAG